MLPHRASSSTSDRIDRRGPANKWQTSRRRQVGPRPSARGDPRAACGTRRGLQLAALAWLSARQSGISPSTVRHHRGAPWSVTTQSCSSPSAGSANAGARPCAAAGWTAATRACRVPRSGAGASGACSPIGAAGPSGGATPRPSDRRRGARFTRHSGYMLGSGTRRSTA